MDIGIKFVSLAEPLPYETVDGSKWVTQIPATKAQAKNSLAAGSSAHAG